MYSIYYIRMYKISLRCIWDHYWPHITLGTAILSQPISMLTPVHVPFKERLSGC